MTEMETSHPARESALVLTSLDPAGDPRVAWIATAAKRARYTVTVHGFGQAPDPATGLFPSGLDVIVSDGQSSMAPEDDALTLIRDSSVLPERVLARAQKLRDLAPQLGQPGHDGPATEGLTAYNWLFLQHAWGQARTTLATIRQQGVKPDIVIATDAVSVLAALLLKAAFGCRIVYDAQTFGPGQMLVSPRPVSAFHLFMRAALKQLHAISFPSEAIQTSFENRYGELPANSFIPYGERAVAFGLLMASEVRTSERVLMLCGHEPTVDPRVIWSAESAAELGYETRIIGWTDGYAPPRTADPDSVSVSRLGGEAGMVPAWRIWQLLLKHKIAPFWIVVMAFLRVFRKTLSTILIFPWVLARLAARRLGIEASTTKKVDKAVRDAYYKWWQVPVEPKLPFRGLAGYYWYFLDYAVVEARKVLFEIEQSGWKPDIIHCNDPDTLVSGALLKSLYGSRLIYDAHEFGPDAYLVKPLPRSLFSHYEAHLFNHVDGAVTVSESIAARFNKHYGDRLGFRVVPNAAPIEPVPVEIELPEIEAAAEGRMRFMFQGGIAPHRGIDQLIREWESVDDTKAVLFIRGPENAHRKGLIEQARATGKLDSSIFFLPSIGEGELIASARHADVGLITYRSHVENHKGASPNKLSQYMQAGAAILSVDLPSVTPILNTFECGEVYDDTTEGALAAKINALALAPEKVKAYGERGRQFAESSYNYSVFFEVFKALYEGEVPKPIRVFDYFRLDAETRRIVPDPHRVATTKKAARNLDQLPEIASDYMARYSPRPMPPYEAEVTRGTGTASRRVFEIRPNIDTNDTKLDQSLVETLAPPQEGMKSVLFLHQSYYHFFHLARALRERGFHALLVSFESPDSANAPFYHGEDLNLWHPDLAVRKARAYDLMEAISRHFKMVHFHGAEIASLFELNQQPPARDAIPWDLLELKRRGVKIGHSISGCNTGQRPSLLYKASGGVCDKCIWQLHPEVCSDPLIGAQNSMLESLLDLNAIEIDWPADSSRMTKGSYYDPLTYCVDTQMWSPDIDVPEDMKFEREPGEVLVFHAVGNYDKRAKNDRNIKGTGAVITAIERLQAEGYPVRLVFKTGVPSKDMKYYQVQADIVVDQLNYGRYGASARECMALGRPVISRFIPEQPKGVPVSRALAECPLVHADETNVYDALKDLLDHPEKREAAGTASRKYALKWHSKDACAARFEIVYDRLMSGLPVYEAGQ